MLSLAIGRRYQDRSGHAWLIVDASDLPPIHVSPRRVFLGVRPGNGPRDSAWFMSDGRWSNTGQDTAIDLLRELP